MVEDIKEAFNLTHFTSSTRPVLIHLSQYIVHLILNKAFQEWRAYMLTSASLWIVSKILDSNHISSVYSTNAHRLNETHNSIRSVCCYVRHFEQQASNATEDQELMIMLQAVRVQTLNRVPEERWNSWTHINGVFQPDRDLIMNYQLLNLTLTLLDSGFDDVRHKFRHYFNITSNATIC